MRQTRPEACLGCFKPFRPRGAKVGDYPATIAHYGLGRCKPCRVALWHNGHPRPEGSMNIEAVRASLELWLARRRPTTLVKVVRL